MERDTIFQKLTAIFAAPLPDFYDRRIVFWHDEDHSFTEMVDSIEIPGVKKLKLTGDNNFYAKKLLSEDDTTSDYLVYDPISYDDIRDNWLLDIQCYSEEFRADILSMQMEQYRVAVTPEMRRLMRAYSGFFANQSRCAKLEKFGNTYHSPYQLHVDILAVLVGTENNTPSGVIRAVLSDGVARQDADCLDGVRKFGDEAAFWSLVRQFTGYEHREGDMLIDLATHVLLSAMSETVDSGFYKGLEGKYAAIYQGNCYAMIHEWMHSQEDGLLYEICREVEDDLNLRSRFEKLELTDLMKCEIFPCVNECILEKLMAAILENTARAELLLQTAEKRRAMKWYKRVENYYQCVTEVAQMQQFYQNHISGFHVALYEQMWKNYQDDYCAMDRHYRKFHFYFGNSLRKSNLYLEDRLKSVADHVEGLYKNWYLKELASRWIDLVREDFSRGSRLEALQQQEDFYARYVSPLVESSGRAFVIISDGLRYEVAKELADQLVAETKGNATLTAMQGTLPTVTKYGMAALLPHRHLEIGENGKVYCDGNSTEGTQNRQKILQMRQSASVAITYKTLLTMKQAEKRELISGKKLVYIYHNAIDVVAESAVTEDHIFEACNNALSEIKNLVRIITNELNGTNILITADHGFLYSYQPLTMAEKAEKDYVHGEILEADRRYILAENGAEGDHLLRIPMGRNRAESILFVPQENIRFKTGGGMNYVHGGISLQEMTVPVIAFKNMRASNKNYVQATKTTLELLSSSRKISNNMFTLEFYQKEPVGGKVSPCTYCVYFTDGIGTMISDMKTIIADKTAEKETDRVTKVRFMLKGQAYDRTAAYFLNIREKDGSEVRKKIPFEINISFVNDFDF